MDRKRKKIKKPHQNPPELDFVSPKLWKAFDQFLKVYKNVAILPFKFRLVERKVSRIPISKGKHFVQKLGPIFLVTHTLICVVILIQNVFRIPEEDEYSRENEIFRIAERFCLFYFITIISAFTQFNYFVAWRPLCLCNIMNSISPLHNRIKALGQINYKQTSNKLLELVVSTFVKYILFILPVIVPGFMWLHLDPMRTPLQILINSENFIPNFFSIFLRATVLTLLWTELLKVVSGIFTLALIVMDGFTSGMRQLRQVQRIRGTSPMRIMRLYSQLQLSNQYLNQTLCYYTIPPLIFFGVGLVTLTNYGTVRLHDVLPLSLYFILPLTSFLGGVFVVVVLPLASKVYETASDFISFLRGRCISRYERRLFYSIKVIGIQSGPFHMLDKPSVVTISKSVVDYTIHLLLTF
ncbi:hypothetical protein Fcan01_01219 [Folsomia candida]|uniref:Uncharacterized protein n=2 Tax=Folsomia candida TaxID=158441 RepID=A0A226F3I6_FOLCA|nr:hypothetical protein Fcan01_01219 [Folsomia candida]